MKKVVTIMAAVMLLCPAFAQKTLKGAYADAFKIGCAVNSQIVSGRDSRSVQIILEQFNAISPENDLKPEVLHPTPDRWNFQAADRYVQEQLTNRTNYPLLFNRDRTSKPAFDAVLSIPK